MRFFIDMDGTLMKWLPIKLQTKEETDNAEELIEKILTSPGYFERLPYESSIGELACNLMNEGYEVYILSCYRPDKITNYYGIPVKSTPLADKKASLKKHLPRLTEDHQIFVPDGMNKAEYLKENYNITLTKADILIDDYWKNLEEWEKSGGTPIKCLNGINSPDYRYYSIFTKYRYNPDETCFIDFIEHLNSIIERDQNEPNKDERE